MSMLHQLGCYPTHLGMLEDDNNVYEIRMHGRAYIHIDSNIALLNTPMRYALIKNQLAIKVKEDMYKSLTDKEKLILKYDIDFIAEKIDNYINDTQGDFEEIFNQKNMMYEIRGSLYIDKTFKAKIEKTDEFLKELHILNMKDKINNF